MILLVDIAIKRLPCAMTDVQDQLLQCLPPLAVFSDTAMLHCQLHIIQCCVKMCSFAELCGFQFDELPFSKSSR